MQHEMEELISARAARELSQVVAKQEVAKIMPLIREAAANSHSIIRLDHGIWTQELSDMNVYQEARNVLEDLGYIVNFYNETEFFTLVSW
jgi:uncharacterized membrane protein affecting hemolysin expression